MNFLTPSYDPTVVAASFLIATLASYVTLDLAKRVRTPDRAVARAWWMGGSVAMGTGIWSMHFVGMLAFNLPIELGYTRLFTFLSWLAAVCVSALSLSLAARGELSRWRLAGGAGCMGLGICAMHYLGMAALDMSPGIVWNAWLVAASVAIAVAASAVALGIFTWLRRVRVGVAGWQIVAALVMGVAISGMHYTGMAAARFPVGSVCLSVHGLNGDSLGLLVTLVSVTLMSMTLVTSMLDARLQGKAMRLAHSLRESNASLQSANEELQRRAFMDPLTGLANRLLFEDRLAHASRRQPRTDDGEQAGRLAVLFVDLDGFKPVNDSFGHAAGDRVLGEAAERLRRSARASDTVARLGGDEFVLLMEDVSDLAEAVAFGERLVQTLAEPFEVAGREVRIAGSVGIAVTPDHGSHDRLLARADAAMYAAKRHGGGGLAVFEPHMETNLLEQMSLQADLHNALANGELSLHYQPKVCRDAGPVRDVEALMRWHHPRRGMVPPVVFIPLAERSGLINALGDWVIDEACRQMRQWLDQGMPMRVAINLSAHQLRQEHLADHIAQALQRHRIEPSQLLCEITESMAMEDLGATQRTVARLGQLGVFLSIDDFGSGYSSLSYLRQLPARQLKIDRAFIKDLETNRDARAVVDAVIHLAHALGLDVVAEGVETAEQRDILLDLGCDELQGFLFARPMPAAALAAWAHGNPVAANAVAMAQTSASVPTRELAGQAA